MNAFRKSTFTAVLVCLFALAACQPDSRPVASPAAVSNTIKPSLTSTLFFPTRTSTITATATTSPTPEPTQTLTPYPSFDARQAVSRTPYKPERCPEENPAYRVVVNLPPKGDYQEYSGYLRTLEDHILEFLEDGASFHQVTDAFNAAFKEHRLNMWDLTGDGVAELVVYKELFTAVIGCADGSYRKLLDFSFGTEVYPIIIAMEDMNLNSTPDIVFKSVIGSGYRLAAKILEWNGEEFVSLIQAIHGENASSTSRIARALNWYESFIIVPDEPVMNGMGEISISDIDGNGTKELVVSDHGPTHHDTLYSFGPWRGRQAVFSWDGLHYLYNALEMDPPLYRFQAVQDADRFFFMGDYARAEQFYRAVITDKDLMWWTPERVRFLLDQQWAEAAGRPTPISPEEDETEYPKLAAYAGYRLILLNVVNGDIDSAECLYADLLKDHPHGSDGYPYVLLADRFLDNFRTTGDPTRACEQVVKYIQSVEGLLAPLGDSNHGGQSHIYEAADLCPFP